MPKTNYADTRTPAELLNRSEPLAEIAIPKGAYLPGLDDAGTYAMRLLGNCLEPVAADGEHAIINPEKPCQPGDFVALIFADGRMPLVKRLLVPSVLPLGKPVAVGNVDGLVMVEMLSPRRILRLRACDVAAIHRVLGFLKRDGSMLAAGRAVQ